MLYPLSEAFAEIAGIQLDTGLLYAPLQTPL